MRRSRAGGSPCRGEARSPDPRRRGQERRSAADRAARRHHGREAHVRRDPALPSTAAVARRRRRCVRSPTATTSRRASAPPAQTGVEMEALHAVAVAALTIYDMIKAVDKAWSSATSARRETRRPERRLPARDAALHDSRRHLQPVRGVEHPAVARRRGCGERFPQHTFLHAVRTTRRSR